jgi:hypothetical protein
MNVWCCSETISPAAELRIFSIFSRLPLFLSTNIKFPTTRLLVYKKFEHYTSSPLKSSILNIYQQSEAMNFFSVGLSNGWRALKLESRFFSAYSIYLATSHLEYRILPLISPQNQVRLRVVRKYSLQRTTAHSHIGRVTKHGFTFATWDATLVAPLVEKSSLSMSSNIIHQSIQRQSPHY